MQKAFSLQPHETAQAQALDEERRNLLARLGAATLEMESVRGQLPTLDQRGRTLVQSIAQRTGVREFISARIDGANLVCEVPNEPAPPHVATLDSLTTGIESDIGHVNGEAIATKR
jgi:hypothetical protein